LYYCKYPPILRIYCKKCYGKAKAIDGHNTPNDDDDDDDDDSSDNK